MTRILAIGALGMLVGMLALQSRMHFHVIKISLLGAAELGLVSLMLSLFLGSKSYFAGLQMLIASLAMLWCLLREVSWLGMCVGLLAIGLGLTNVLTRRSRLNALLGLKLPAEEAGAPSPKAAAGVQPGSLTEGGSHD